VHLTAEPAIHCLWRTAGMKVLPVTSALWQIRTTKELAARTQHHITQYHCNAQQVPMNTHTVADETHIHTQHPGPCAGCRRTSISSSGSAMVPSRCSSALTPDSSSCSTAAQATVRYTVMPTHLQVHIAAIKLGMQLGNSPGINYSAGCVGKVTARLRLILVHSPYWCGAMNKRLGWQRRVASDTSTLCWQGSTIWQGGRFWTP
jgi:hypothetical protein